MSWYHKFLDDSVRSESASTGHGLAYNTDDKLVVGALAGIVVLFAITFALYDPGSQIFQTGEDGCPIDKRLIQGRTWILMDLSEILDQEQQDDLVGMLTNVATKMETREQIVVNQMQEKGSFKRKPLYSFCAPDISELYKYGNRMSPEMCGAILRKTKTKRKGEQEYDAERYSGWHPNFTKRQKENVIDACVAYDKQEQKAKKVANVPSKQGADSSHIVSAIESLMRDEEKKNDSQGKDGERRVPARIIIFSDMLQNVKWFNQYTLNPSQWTIDDLMKKRETQNGPDAMGDRPENPFDSTLLCYLNDRSGTIKSANEKKHRDMWMGYFKYDNDDTQVYVAEQGECANQALALIDRNRQAE